MGLRHIDGPCVDLYGFCMQERDDSLAAALWTAAWNGNEVVVEHLIAEAVNITVWDRYGRNALFQVERLDLKTLQDFRSQIGVLGSTRSTSDCTPPAKPDSCRCRRWNATSGRAFDARILKRARRARSTI